MALAGWGHEFEEVKIEPKYSLTLPNGVRFTACKPGNAAGCSRVVPPRVQNTATYRKYAED